MFKNSITGILLSLSLTTSFAAWAIDFRPCPVESLSIQKKDRVFDQVLLVPGAGADGENLMLGYVPYGEYYADVKETLRELGIHFKVLGTHEHGNQTVEERVEQVKAELAKAQAKGKKVMLLGHSMGGLVVRIASRDPKFNDTLVGTLTLSAPHRGTEMADWLLAQNEKTPWIQTISKWVGFPIDQKEYLAELSVKDAPRFVTPYDEDKTLSPIFSVINSDTTKGFMISNPAFKVTDEIISRAMSRDNVFHGETDGMVPARSQAFGVCLGWVEADHGLIIGKSLRPHHSEISNEIIKTIFEKLSDFGLRARVPKH